MPSTVFPTSTFLRSRWFLGILLVAALLLAYGQLWHAGFLWDDDSHLTKNPCIVGPLGFVDIWITPAATYYPLVLSAFWLEHALWGLAPLPYHLVNLLLHASCALLLWKVLLELRIPGAWLGSALWALHPVQVESVAWVTEQKNTQSCLFYLLSILCFLRWLDHSNGPLKFLSKPLSWPYLLSLLFALLAILSKSSTVMLPMVLALCCWWREGTWTWRKLWALAPFFLLSASASLWTIWEQKFHSGAVGAEWNQSLAEKLVLAGKVPWFYLGKLAWPDPLIFIYPRWNLDASLVFSWLPLLGVVLVLLLLWYKRETTVVRAILFAWAYFLISLFPVMGFFSVYFFRYSFVGDHFQYLAGMGPLALAGAAMTLGLRRLGSRTVAVGIMTLVLIALGVLSWKQSSHYLTEESLWRDTIGKNTRCWMALNNLGFLFLTRGEPDGAIVLFQKGLQINPGDAEAEKKLGWAFRDKGQLDDAVFHLKRSISLDHDDLFAHYNLAGIYSQQGLHEAAVLEYQEALRIQPADPDSLPRLGQELLSINRREDAIAAYRKLVVINPADAGAWHNLGKLLFQQNSRAEGIRNLKESLRLQPSKVEVLNDLAWMLSTAPDDSLRDGKRALELALQAEKASGGADPGILDTLAAAYAETGDYPKAVEKARKALGLAKQQRNKELASSLKEETALYEAGKPVRDPR